MQSDEDHTGGKHKSGSDGAAYPQLFSAAHHATTSQTWRHVFQPGMPYLALCPSFLCQILKLEARAALFGFNSYRLRVNKLELELEILVQKLDRVLLSYGFNSYRLRVNKLELELELEILVRCT